MHPAAIAEIEARTTKARKIPAWIFHGGRKYLSICAYAEEYDISPQATRKWAERHPEQTRQHNAHTYILERP